MATIDDAIFLMDDEVICDIKIKPIKSTTKKTVRDETIQIVHVAKSPPINIIKPKIVEIKKRDDFVPSSPSIYSHSL